MAQYEDCKFFMRGACTRGLHCGFRHSELASKTELICQEWAIGKWCKGDCNLRHPSALELGALAAAAAAAGSGRKTVPGYPPSSPLPCKFYAKGKCTKGERCPFLHADQTAQSTPTPRSPQPAMLSLRAAAAAARSRTLAEANTNAKANGDEPLAQSRTLGIPPVSSVPGQASSVTASAAAKAKGDEILRKHKLPRTMNDGQAHRPHRGTTAGAKRIRGDSSLSQTERDSLDLEELRNISPSDLRSPQSGEMITGRLQGVPGSFPWAAGRDSKTGDNTPTVSAAGISTQNENPFSFRGVKASIAESTFDTGTVSVASAPKSSGCMGASTVRELAGASEIRGPDAASAGSPSTALGISRLDLPTSCGAENSTPSPRRMQDARISGTSPERSPTQTSKEMTRNAVMFTGLEQTAMKAILEVEEVKVPNEAQRAPAHEDSPLTVLSSGERGPVLRRPRARTLVGDEGDAQYRCWSSQSPTARETDLDEGNAAIVMGDCRDGPKNDAGLQRDDQALVSTGTVSRSRQDCPVADKEQADRDESVVDKHCKRIIGRVNEEEMAVSPLDVPPSTIPPASHALSVGKMLTAVGSERS